MANRKVGRRDMNEMIRQATQRASGRFRRHVRTLWQARGGGFYGFAFVLMFLYLEVVDLAGDLAALPSVSEMTTGWAIGWLVANAVDAMLNLLWAFIWPVQWVDRFGVGLLSAGLLTMTYIVYRLIRPAVWRLLQEPADVPAAGERPAPAPAPGTPPPPAAG